MVHLHQLVHALNGTRPVIFSSGFTSCSAAMLQGAPIAKKPGPSMPTAHSIARSAQNVGIDIDIDIDADECAADRSALERSSKATPLSWSCVGIGTQPVVDVPKYMRKLFARFAEEYYTTEYVGNEGIWYAVLFGLDTEFFTRTPSSQEKLVGELKHQLSNSIDDYYARCRYRQFGYSRTDMYRVLQTANLYHPSLGHYMSDFMAINIMVVLPHKKYYFIGVYDAARVTLVVFNEGVAWGSVVHPDRSHLFADISFIADRYTPLARCDVSAQVTDMDEMQIAALRREMRKLKIAELQAKALEMELCVHDGNGKKKKKGDLCAEIFTEITGIPFCATVAAAAAAAAASSAAFDVADECGGGGDDSS